MKYYPDKLLDIRVDEQGNISYEQNPQVVRYLAPTEEDLQEKMEELEELQERLELLELDEPLDLDSSEYAEWEDEKDDLEQQIQCLEEEIDEMEDE